MSAMFAAIGIGTYEWIEAEADVEETETMLIKDKRIETTGETA